MNTNEHNSPLARFGMFDAADPIEFDATGTRDETDPFGQDDRRVPPAPAKPGPHRLRKTMTVEEHLNKNSGARAKPAALGPRSKALMEAQGYLVGPVEHHNAYSGQKTDLFGLFDYLCVKRSPCDPSGDSGALGLQVTSVDNLSNHVRKALEEHRDELRVWLDAGNRAVLHCWAKPGKWKTKGDPRRWTLIVVEFGLDADRNPVEASRTEAQRP